jgi:succinyl-diaminopimelate desuccinylase
MTETLAQRTLELVNIASESRHETEIVDYVRAAVPGSPVYDGDTVLLYGVEEARVLLAGHVDTVPAQDNLPGRFEEGCVVGLGASVM